MSINRFLLPLLLTLTSVRLLAQEAEPPPPTLEELAAQVEAQQRRIEALETELSRTGADLDAAVDYVESLDSGGDTRATTLGGYGELHYNSLDARDPSNDVDEIDFHRFVLFVGHRFSDRIQLHSEIEIEHALTGDGKPGEVEIEQAYVDIRLRDSLTAKAGLFLLPIGLLNETHEPTTFYGVERNDVENIIVPTTWWEAGGGFSGNLDSGIGWDIAIHSGLAMPTEGASAFRVRSGRQKVAEASAENFAYTARVRYAGIRGLELGASLQYQSDPSQMAGDGLDSGRLLSAHAAFERGDFSVKALYGSWDFDGWAVEAAGADKQDGWFVEPAYRVSPRWGVYARFEAVDGAREQDQFEQIEAGFNFWPHSSVVLKFDYRDRKLDSAAQSGRDFNGFDLGVGYHF